MEGAVTISVHKLQKYSAIFDFMIAWLWIQD